MSRRGFHEEHVEPERERGTNGEQRRRKRKAQPQQPPDGAVDAGNGKDGGAAADIADNAEIERLAKLPALEYERGRKAAAERLKMRASILDKVVQAERAKLGLEGAVGQGRAIEFPAVEPWGELVNGAALLDDIATALRDHVVMDAHACAAVALWVVHGFLLDRFQITPRLCIRSAVKGSGKTTLLDVVARLVLRPLPAANVTAASIFRVVELCRPTLLIDEADALFADGGNEELRGILNSGHRRGGQVLRVVGDEHEPRAFATFCPTVIALIGALPGTLHDRSIVIDLQRRKPSEPVTPFRLDRTGRLDTLARRIARWTEDQSDAISQHDPAVAGLHNRAADNWRPLLAIADEAGGQWPVRARQAALASRVMDTDDSSRLELLLGDIRDVLDDLAVDRISSAHLIEKLCEIVPRPWSEYGRSGKPLTQNKLARLLKPLGVAPQVLRIGTETPSGYHRHQFEEAWDRLLPPQGGFKPQQPNKCDEMGTSELFQTSTGKNDVEVGKSQKSNNDGVCLGVEVAKGGQAVCAQCGHPGGNEVAVGEGQTIRLHPECERAFLDDGDDGRPQPEA